MKRRGFLKMIGGLIGAAAVPAVAKRADDEKFVVHDIDTRRVMTASDVYARKKEHSQKMNECISSFMEDILDKQINPPLLYDDLSAFGTCVISLEPGGGVRRVAPKDWPKL